MTDSTTTTPYDIVQTTFLLCMAANGAADIKAKQASDLQGYLETALNGGTDPVGTQFDGFFPRMNSLLAGGDWSVVWGPCVYPRPVSSLFHETYYEAANSMYVAYSPSLSTYVVAIAGTNPISHYDWDSEDFDVSPEYMAEWPPQMPFDRQQHTPYSGVAAISAATATGVSNLLTQLTDPDHQGSLPDFLKSVENSKDMLIFCGHSLGGALAPTLAFYIYPQPAQSGWGQVLVLPLAGPTPGNGLFAQQFNAAYPPVPAEGVSAAYGRWNTDFANSADAVPHAWNQLSMIIGSLYWYHWELRYPSMYGVMDALVGYVVRYEVDKAEAMASGGDYTNITQSVFDADSGYWAWTQNPDGSWQYPPVWTPAPQYTDASPMTNKTEMMNAVSANHIDQYYNFFGVTPAPRMPISLPSST